MDGSRREPECFVARLLKSVDKPVHSRCAICFLGERIYVPTGPSPRKREQAAAAARTKNECMNERREDRQRINTGPVREKVDRKDAAYASPGARSFFINQSVIRLPPYTRHLQSMTAQILASLKRGLAHKVQPWPTPRYQSLLRATNDCKSPCLGPGNGK